MVLVERDLRVIIVDDDAQNRALLVEVFRGEGFLVEIADSAEEALRRVREGAADLVVAEATMSGMSGVELTRAIRATPFVCDLPIVLLSASPLPELRRMAIEMGASAYVEKPFRVFELTDRVRKLARPRRVSDEPPTLPGIRLRRAKQDSLVDLPSGLAFRASLRRALSALGPGETASLLLVRVADDDAARDRSAWTALLGAFADVLREHEGAMAPRAVFRLDDGELASLGGGDCRPELGLLLQRLLEEGVRVLPGSPALPVWVAGVVARGPLAAGDGDRVLRFGRALLVRGRREGISVLADEVREEEIPDSRSAALSNKKPEPPRRRTSSAPPRKPKPPS